MAEFQTDVRVTCRRKQWVAGTPAKILHLHPSIAAPSKKEMHARYRYTTLALFRHDDGSLWLLTSTLLTGGGKAREGSFWVMDPKHREHLEYWEGYIPDSRLLWLKRHAWFRHNEGNYSISIPAKTLDALSRVIGAERSAWLLSRFAPHHAVGLVRAMVGEVIQTWLPL